MTFASYFSRNLNLHAHQWPSRLAIWQYRICSWGKIMSKGLYSFAKFFTEWLDRSDDPLLSTANDFDQIRNQLKPSDILLAQGQRLVDRTVYRVSGSHWTHAVLYVGRPMDMADTDMRNTLHSYIDCSNDTPLVIETSLNHGVQLRPLSDFEHHKLRICRARSLTTADAMQVIRYALSRLGPRRAVLQFLDLLRFFIPWWIVPPTWRRAIFRHNPGRHTRNAACALIADAFGFIQYPILPLVKVTSDHGTQLFRRQIAVCLPADIEASPYFEIIKPTFLDFSRYSTDELFPWRGSGVFTMDEAVQPEPARLQELSKPSEPSEPPSILETSAAPDELSVQTNERL
ncbi:Hypothetical protein HDN1F_33410 [gamma proteobacterium HdN1]|nr:Hypothetical protein HDN1F_33410 [gamma proteobacterium HdN1]